MSQVLRCLFSVLAWMVLVCNALGDDNAPHDKLPPTRMVGGFSIYQIGDIDPQAWRRFTGKEQMANVSAEKAFVKKGIDSSHSEVKLYESPHFLIYTDVNQYALQYGKVLESTYTALANFLGVTNGSDREPKQGQDVWRGKAIVFLFHDNNGSAKLLPALHPKAIAGTSLLLNGNGTVEISRDNSDMIESEREVDFAMTEAFLFRWRSPLPLPTWIANGFASSFADTNAPPDKVLFRPDIPPKPPADQRAAEFLKDHDLAKVIDGSLDADYHATVTNDSLAAYMVRRNRPGYVALLKSIKDGMGLDEALSKKYKSSLEQIKTGYLNYLARVH